MGKINYNDKQFLYQNADIPAENKVNDVDMNEIKDVVNENDDLVGDLSNLDTTNKSSIVEAINELAYDSGWQDAILNRDFDIYSSTSICKYRKVGKTVAITGQVKAKRTLTEGVIFVLPEGFRPDYTMWFVQQGSGTAKWLLMLNPNGNVYAQRYGTTSQVDFTTGYWLPISVTFLAG